jgi:hypothetical protein
VVVVGVCVCCVVVVVVAGVVVVEVTGAGWTAGSTVVWEQADRATRAAPARDETMSFFIGMIEL